MDAVNIQCSPSPPNSSVLKVELWCLKQSAGTAVHQGQDEDDQWWHWSFWVVCRHIAVKMSATLSNNYYHIQYCRIPHVIVFVDMLCSIAASSVPCNSGSLSVLISESQMLMRHYAEKELKEAFDHKPSADKVTELAHSCVSQRDIQVCCFVLGLPPLILRSLSLHLAFHVMYILYTFCLFLM